MRYLLEEFKRKENLKFNMPTQLIVRNNLSVKFTQKILTEVKFENHMLIYTVEKTFTCEI